MGDSLLVIGSHCYYQRRLEGGLVGNVDWSRKYTSKLEMNTDKDRHSIPSIPLI